MPDVDVGTVYGRLQLRDAGFKQALAQANLELKRFEVQAKLAAERQEALNAVIGRARTAMLALGAAGVGLGVVFVKAAAQMEQTKMAFTSLLKSGDAATAMLKDLRDFAAKTPFEFNDLTRATQKLMAFGFEAKQIIPMLTAVGDAAAAMGGDPEVINRSVRALGQIRSAGKLMTEDMNQLTEVGIPAWQFMADAIGKSTGEIRQMTTDGVIPADVAIKALLQGMSGRFGGLMAEQAKTAVGGWSNLMDEIERTKVVIGEAFLPTAKQALGAVNSALGDLTDEQRRSLGVWTVYGTTVAGAGGVLMVIVSGIGGVIRNLKVLDAALGVSISKATSLGTAIGAAMAAAGLWYANRLEDEHERKKATTLYQMRLPVEVQGLWDETKAEGTFDAYLRRRNATARLNALGYNLTPMGPVPRDAKALKAMGYVAAPGGVEPTPATPQMDMPPNWKQSPLKLPPAPVKASRAARARSVRIALETGPMLGPSREEWERVQNALFEMEMAEGLALVEGPEVDRRLKPYSRGRPRGLAPWEYRAQLPPEPLEPRFRRIEAAFAGARIERIRRPEGLLGPSAATAGPVGLMGAEAMPLLGSIERLRYLQELLAGAQARRDGARARALEGEILALSGQLIAREGAESGIGLEASRIRSPVWDARRQRRGATLSDMLPGVAAAGIGVASGQSTFGQAASGLIGGYLSSLGPWGAVAGVLVDTLLSGDSEEDRRHREAQAARERMARQMAHMNDALTPVSDYFRSASLDNLPGSSTFGGSLEEEISRGPRL